MSHELRMPPAASLVSHTFPCTVLLPGSESILTLFPACIEIDSDSLYLEPNCQFLSHTTRLDALNQKVVIEGITPKGFQRLIIFCDGERWKLYVQKLPLSGIHRVPFQLVRGDSMDLFSALPIQTQRGRLVLTSPTTHAWEQLILRKQWRTLVEHLYLMPKVDADEKKEKPRDSLLKHISEDVDCLEPFVLTGFSSMCVPRVGDEVGKKWGMEFWPYSSIQKNLNCFHDMLRSIFLREQKGHITLLPQRTKLMPSGQLIQESCCDGLLSLSFDWRKELPRRVFLTPHEDLHIDLSVPPFAVCRIREGKTVSNVKLGKSLFLEKNKRYLLDNFLS